MAYPRESFSRDMVSCAAISGSGDRRPTLHDNLRQTPRSRYDSSPPAEPIFIGLSVTFICVTSTTPPRWPNQRSTLC